ncbi:MAG: deoxyribodipyrimidine photo-lyase [Ignavibacteriales bacterium]|nr:MAG: deoxyribodipyrimidine photo-lyase [Ignavibacteriales bacterium]
MVNEKRVRLLKAGNQSNGAVVYWMSRDQRVHDNWALLYAQEKAAEANQPLFVVFALVNEFLGATLRQYDFMLKGLKEVEVELRKLNIPFILLPGSPQIEISRFVKENSIGLLVADFDPLKIKKEWKKKVSEKISVPFYEVDAHNIVPCWIASDKEEFAAYTFRPKIHKLLPEFLDEYPPLIKMKDRVDISPIDRESVYSSLKINKNVKPVDWIRPGESAALNSLSDFLDDRLNLYSVHRNDPNQQAQSDISPYLHFGQISAQRVLLNYRNKFNSLNMQDDFPEELVVRRELADNYCNYNENYDSFDGFRAWAKQTLNEHRKDDREYIYSLDVFENAATHDELWNAAQRQMIDTGKMHGYMRMYWAKKILEWSKNPEEAIHFAIYLNDKYELDGRDPNGYTGVAWSIGGIHDRAWFDRPVFGKIRYMNYNGAKKKFDVISFIDKHTS